jgi:hypothetical protein
MNLARPRKMRLSSVSKARPRFRYMTAPWGRVVEAYPHVGGPGRLCCQGSKGGKPRHLQGQENNEERTAKRSISGSTQRLCWRPKSKGSRTGRITRWKSTYVITVSVDGLQIPSVLETRVFTGYEERVRF